MRCPFSASVVSLCCQCGAVMFRCWCSSSAVQCQGLYILQRRKYVTFPHDLTLLIFKICQFVIIFTLITFILQILPIVFCFHLTDLTLQLCVYFYRICFHEEKYQSMMLLLVASLLCIYYFICVAGICLIFLASVVLSYITHISNDLPHWNPKNMMEE